MRSNTRRIALPLGILAAAIGCSDSSGPGPDEGVIDGIQTNVTDPAEVLAAHARALSEMSLEAYLALLDPEFRFTIYEGDAPDFPWLTEDSWPLEAESEMIGNMMDPEFAGGVNPVVAVQTMLTVIEIREDSHALEVTADATFDVLIAPTDGWVSDTRLVFELITDQNEFLRIQAIREIERVSPLSDDPPGLERATWGRIKMNFSSIPPRGRDQLSDAILRTLRAEKRSAKPSLL